MRSPRRPSGASPKPLIWREKKHCRSVESPAIGSGCSSTEAQAATTKAAQDKAVVRRIIAAFPSRALRTDRAGLPGWALTRSLIRLAEMRVEPREHLARGFARRCVEVGGFGSDGEGIPTARTRFDHAANVGAAPRPVDIPEMHFQSRQPVLEPAETFAKMRFDALGDVLRTHQGAVGIELNVHDEGRCSWSLGCVRATSRREQRFPAVSVCKGYIFSPGSSLAWRTQLAN